MRRIIVLHEYGAPEHFRGLEQFVNRHQNDFVVQYVEFRIIKNILKGIVKRDIHKVIKNIRNIGSILSLLFKRNEIVIIGMAPYDGFVAVANLISKRHHVVYYSSWPIWDHSRYPKKVWIFKSAVDSMWNKFTPNVRFVGVTKNGANSFLKENKCINEWIIPHSYSSVIYFPNYSKAEQDKKKVIYVGRIVEEKGIRYILEAAISPELCNNYEYTFIGDGDEKLIERIKELSLSNKNIIYKGRINDQSVIAAEYRDSDIILLPSYKTDTWEELFGIVLIEAMACGVVPIATDCIGPRSIITNGTDGFLVQQKNTKVLIDALNQLRSNKKMFRSMRKNAIQTAQDYNVENCDKKWEEVIDNIISNEDIRYVKN